MIRRTRANPSPSGLRALPMNETKKRKATGGRRAPAKRARVEAEDEQSSQLAQPTQPTESIQPTLSPHTSQSTQPAPASPSQHTSPSQPIQPTSPFQLTQSVSPSQPSSPSPITQTTSPLQATQPEPRYIPTLTHPTGMMTDLIRKREAMYLKMVGKPMPKLRKLKPEHYGPFNPAPVEVEHESEDDLGEDYMDGPELTRLTLRNWASSNRGMLAPPLSQSEMDKGEAMRKQAKEDNRAPLGPLPRTTIPPPKPVRTMIPPSPSMPPVRRSKLTRPDIVKAAQALKHWCEHESRQAPTPAEMEALLNSFYAQKEAKIDAESRHIDQQGETHVELTSGEHADAEQTHDEVVGNQSEVATETHEPHTPKHHASEQQTTEPQTPVSSSGLQESRGIWAGISAVKNMIATPLNYFRRSSVSAVATNINPVPGEFTFRHPHNLQPQQYPSTPMPSARPRKAAAQTERKARPQTPNLRYPQTERRRRPIAELKPIHERGVMTPAEIAEVHRRQDREKQRRVEMGLSEEDDTTTQYSRPGSKRKRPQRNLPKPQNTFTVPEGDSDGGDAPQAESPLHNRDIEWPCIRRWMSVGDEMQGNREEYARKYHIPMYQVPKDDLILHRMFHPWQARKEYLARNAPTIDFGAWDLRQKAAERIAADEEGLPLWPGVDSPYGGDQYNDYLRDDIRFRERDRPRTMDQYRHLFPPYPEKVAVPPNLTSSRLRPEQAADNDRVPPYTGSVVPSNANLYQGQNPDLFSRDLDNGSAPLFSKSETSYNTRPWAKGSSSRTPVPSPWMSLNKRSNRSVLAKTVSLGPRMASQSMSSSTSAAPQPATTGTYGFSYDDDDSSDDEKGDVAGPQKTPDSHIPGSFPPSPAQNVFGKSGLSDASDPLADSGALEPKKWTQTPPPKPRPGNAQLPQQQAQPAANNTEQQTPQRQVKLSNIPQLQTPAVPEIPLSPAEKATAKAMKFAPAQPSGLRNMTKMSPLQIQQENLALQSAGQTTFGQIQRGNTTQFTAQNDFGQSEKENIAPQDTVQNTVFQKEKFVASMQNDYNNTTFDPVVAKYVNSIPENEIRTEKLPDHLYTGWGKGRSAAERATDQYFT